jgi:hypothetical protein
MPSATMERDDAIDQAVGTDELPALPASAERWRCTRGERSTDRTRRRRLPR